MSIKIYLLILLIIPTKLLATSYAPSGWHWHTYALHNSIGFYGMEDELISAVYLKSSLENCLKTLSIDDGCNDASEWLILLSKMDSESSATISISNRLIQAIPDDFTRELYFIREYAARALARRGLPDKLLEEMDGDEPFDDDAMLMAEAGDYRWSDTILNGLQNYSNFSFCQTTLFVPPFLSSDNDTRQSFIDALTNSLMAETSYQASCATYLLFNISSPTTSTETTVRLSINKLLNSDNSEWHKTAALLTDKWPISIVSNQTLVARIIKLAASSDNDIVQFYLNYALKDLDIIANLFPRYDPQEAGQKDSVDTNSSKRPTFEEYMMSHSYNEVWLRYANGMKFTDMQDLLAIMSSTTNTVSDLGQKLSYFADNTLITNNRHLKSKLAEVAIDANSPLASQLLNELYTSADGLQKNAMIARYPQYFTSKPVVRLNNTNLWIKLAEITNLLTICKVEVPAIGSELSDPEKLTKYLEDAENLMKDCSRVN